MPGTLTLKQINERFY